MRLIFTPPKARDPDFAPVFERSFGNCRSKNGFSIGAAESLSA